MIKNYYIILVALPMPLALFAQDLPSWRSPAESELGEHSAWRKEDPDRYLLVRADFDGDGKEDTARLVINDKENKMGMMVKLSTLGKAEPLLIETNSDKGAIKAIGIKIAKPGKYQTACGKGYYDCKNGEPEQIQLDRPGIDFFKYETANMFFLWNAAKKTFNEIYMSD